MSLEGYRSWVVKMTMAALVDSADYGIGGMPEVDSQAQDCGERNRIGMPSAIAASDAVVAADAVDSKGTVGYFQWHHRGNASVVAGDDQIVAVSPDLVSTVAASSSEDGLARGGPFR